MWQKSEAAHSPTFPPSLLLSFSFCPSSGGGRLAACGKRVRLHTLLLTCLEKAELLSYDSIEATIHSIEATNDSIEATTDSIEATMDSIEATIDSIEATIGSIEATIGSIEATIVAASKLR